MKSYVYILTDTNRTFLYVGITEDLEKAAISYKNGLPLASLGFPASIRLVYYETVHSESTALQRLRSVASFTRMQKEKLIRKANPNWVDLSNSIRQNPHLFRDICNAYQRYAG